MQELSPVTVIADERSDEGSGKLSPAALTGVGKTEL